MRYLDSVTGDVYEFMEGKPRKRGLLFLLLLFFILLALVYQYPVTTTETVTETIPREVVRSVPARLETQCQNIPFSWSDEWLGWEPATQGMITPIYLLQNEEQESGTFEVQFGFFNEELYPYELYEGIPYDQVRDKLPWHLATMHSKRVEIRLGGGQGRTVILPTYNVDPSASLWVYPDIVPPNKTTCINKRIPASNETVVVHEEVNRYVERENKVSGLAIIGGMFS